MATLPLTFQNASRALVAFRASCPSLLRRVDGSGLTQGADWQSVCQSASSADLSPVDFFKNNFETVQVGSGAAFATGYFIPEIAASRTSSADYNTPIYKRPADEMDVDLGPFSDALKGKTIHGHVVNVPIATGTQARFLPYPEREQIVAGALNDPSQILAYAQDPVAFFFLQVQGSGILRFPDGHTTRIGYAGQNGHDYTGIGSVMKAQGLFADGAYSYQNITNYLRTHPAEAQGIMNSNKSFVFFRELPDNGIPGALGVPLTDRTSVAADPQFIPLGAPVFLSMDRAEPNGLWIAQDTGGAIKGANRVDTYWGAGATAQAIAGGMSSHGTAFLLLPKGMMARSLLSGTQTPAP
jgi:membrane-bound lytic murein transglycosylase A